MAHHRVGHTEQEHQCGERADVYPAEVMVDVGNQDIGDERDTPRPQNPDSEQQKLIRDVGWESSPAPLSKGKDDGTPQTNQQVQDVEGKHRTVDRLVALTRCHAQNFGGIYPRCEGTHQSHCRRDPAQLPLLDSRRQMRHIPYQAIDPIDCQARHRKVQPPDSQNISLGAVVLKVVEGQCPAQERQGRTASTAA